MAYPKELSTVLRRMQEAQLMEPERYLCDEPEPTPDVARLLREAIAKLDAAVALLKEAQCRDSQN